jgi:dienelactone hydrolase
VHTEYGIAQVGAALADAFGMLSPVLAAKIFADEAACLFRRARSRALPAMPWTRVVEEVQQASRIYEGRGWLAEPATYHRTPRAPASVTSVSQRTRWAEFEHVEFESGYRPRRDEPGRERWLSYPACRTMHAWVLRSEAECPRPWLVCIPGYGMGQPAIDIAAFQASELRRALNVNIAIPVLPLHGPRRIGWLSGDGYFAGDCLDTLHAQAQALWDIRRLIRWIRAGGDQTIGLFGLSLGGYTAALLASLDADLACVVVGLPASDFIGLAQLHVPANILEAARDTGLVWEQVARLYRVISPLAMEVRVPWERRYLVGATADRIVPLTQVRQLWRHWQRPKSCWYRGSHLSFVAEAHAQAWLREALTKHLSAQEPSMALADALAPASA